jgi:uncharacterized protein YkwD
MTFNFIDILLLVLVLLNVWSGWHRGFILGALDLARWILSFLAALYFYQPAARLINSVTNWSESWTPPLAFVILLILAGLLIQYFGSRLLARLPNDVHERRVNQIFGILPGFASGLIMAAILSALFLALPLSDGLQEKLRESQAANRLAAYTDILETKLVPIFEEPLKTLNRPTTIQPGSTESVELPFKTESFRPRPDLEAEMLELVNQERTSRGLPPVAPDPEMTEVARKHSADMFARGYFSHNTPEGRDPFDRMRADDVKFRTAGENLALAPTLSIAHNGLMNSPGHRENILRSQFGRLGIGILDGGRYGLMVTQNFRNE